MELRCPEWGKDAEMGGVHIRVDLREKSGVASPQKLKHVKSKCDNEQSALTHSPDGLNLKHAGELRVTEVKKKRLF